MVATATTSGTVQEGSGEVGSRIVSKRYPVTEGLTAGTTKQTGKINIVETEKDGENYYG